ncbi:MAG: hypothetical protein P0S96_05470 [Simkaniaceae bacterium]|nr:hypothetical protein [Candidatus Sacchlamyda saccharinae]
MTIQPIALLDRPVLYPVRLVARPLLWTIAKVRAAAQIFVGYFVRIGVFSFGEWNHSFIKRKVIELYKGDFCDVQGRGHFSPIRLEQAFAMLCAIGGKRFDIESKDGTKLDAMHLRYVDVKAKIEEHGGKIVDSFPVSIDTHLTRSPATPPLYNESRSSPKEYVDIILPNKPGEKWDDFSQKILMGMGLENVQVKLRDGEVVDAFIVKHWDERRPTRPKPGQCFVRSNSPTESYAMAKRDMMRRIFGTKGDVLCYDYRGTWKSEGKPSEGGYYLDAETMVEKAANDLGYAWRDIWAEGFCLGGAVAVHLKKKYHDKGINLFVQNSFDKMLHTLQSQVFPANWLAGLGLNETHSRSPAVIAQTEQDGFDSIAKLDGLKTGSKDGVSIVFNTTTDTTIDARSHAALASRLDGICKKTFAINYEPTDKSRNGHRLDLLGEAGMWDRAVTFITAKDHPKILEPRRGWFS